MLLVAIFLVSLSTLAFEVLLTRVFSIGQWNHLSFMVISIALFGFAASGTFLSILDNRKKGWIMQLSAGSPLAVIVALYSFATLLSFFVLIKIPLDYFRLPLEPVQSLYLFSAYLFLALPFFFAGLLISLAYAAIPYKAGFVYFFSMAGSALGAVTPACLLPYFGEERLIVFCALTPIFFVLCMVLRVENLAGLEVKTRSLIRIVLLLFSLAIIVTAVLLVTANGSSIIRVQPSPYKAISQLLQYPNTRIDKETTTIRGRTAQLKTPYIRFAPGLSLKFTDDLPKQQAVFRDGDDQFVLYDLDAENGARFASFTLSFSGYHVSQNPESVLVIENGGGLAIACAIASGAGDVEIAVQNPQLAGIIAGHYRLPVKNRNPRSYLAQTAKKFDIIHVEDWGTSIPGTDALTQQHLFTTNALAQYLSRLKPGGLVIISRRLLLPPANSIRLWASSYEALKMRGIKYPVMHLAMLRNWDTFTLIISSKPFGSIEKLKRFALDRNFDFVFAGGLDPKLVNRFNIFDRPYHFREIKQLTESYQAEAQRRYYDRYLLDISPQNDNRPYPGRFLRMGNLMSIYKSMGSRIYAMQMSGEIVVWVVFFEAIAISGLLLFVTQAYILKGSGKPAVSQIIFFIGIGSGFMFVELFFIKRLVLIFGNPVISLTVVLCAILVFSSLGGLWTQARSRTALRLALILLIATLVLITVGVEWLIERVLVLSSFWQYVLAVLLLAPCGFLMGLPFPIGIHFLLKNPVQRSYGWSVNGCASVLASIGSVQIALTLGLPFIMGFAVLSYVIALLSVPKNRQIH
jgi:hypothetical protein